MIHILGVGLDLCVTSTLINTTKEIVKVESCHLLKYLHLRMQGAPLLEEGPHHLLSDGEVRRELGAAADHIGVHTVEELESVEVIVLPVLNDVFWKHTSHLNGNFQ